MRLRWAVIGGLGLAMAAPASAAAATFTVTNTNDAGAGSLRQALIDANGNGNPAEKDVVSVETAGTVSLASSLSVSQSVAIVGPGARQFILDGNFTVTTVLSLNAPGEIEVRDLTITRGLRGISTGNGPVTFTRLAIVNNGRTGGIGGDSAGGVDAGFGGLRIFDSTISGNFVGTTGFVSGGGIGFSGGTGNLIVNSTIANNSVDTPNPAPDAESGAGLFISNNGTLDIRNSTITGNSAGGVSSGISAEFNGDITLSSTILSDPVGGPLCHADPLPNPGTIVSQGYNLARDNSCFLTGPGDQPGVDPLLGPLQDNGGPTDTRALDAASPAIDRGNANGLSADQRGFARIADQPTIENAVDGSDVGAVEIPVLCRGAIPTVVGSDASETLVGTEGPDVIQALGGNDKVRADDGDDVVCGGLGKDRLGGGVGKDLLAGEAGRDKLIGGSGKDRLLGGRSKDTCIGAGGKDKGSGCERERSVP